MSLVATFSDDDSGSGNTHDDHTPSFTQRHDNLDSTLSILAEKMSEFSLTSQSVALAQKMIDEKGTATAAHLLGYDTSNYELQIIGGRLRMAELRKTAASTLLEYVKRMEHRLNHNTKQFMLTNSKQLQSLLDQYEWCNYRFDYMSASIMIETYLARADRIEQPAEMPTLMYLRVAVQEMGSQGIRRVTQAFKDYSVGRCTPASPTIFNAGFERPQMSSCFKVCVPDSIEGIYDSLKTVALISQSSGGNGIGISSVRAKGSKIRHVGTSQGVVPVVKLFDDTLRYVDQGGGFRKGAGTLFLDTHHNDVLDFVKMTDNFGHPNQRVDTVNTALWTSWIFWERVREKGDWTLFCPSVSKKLNTLYGSEFAQLYRQMEKDESIAPDRRSTVKALDLLKEAIKMQIRSGKPYILGGDSANFKSAHRHIGVFRQSNLCLEIFEFVSPDEINVCNLKSINLAYMVRKRYTSPPNTVAEAVDRINFRHLGKTAWRCVRYLNKVIDNNFYPLDKDDGETLHRGSIHKTNMKYRALGIGVSGMDELFKMSDLIFTSDIAGKMDELVFACIYFNAIASSVQEAILNGKHDVWEGSTFSEGKFQFDLWQEEYIHRWGRDGKKNPVWKYEDTLEQQAHTWGQAPISLYDQYGNVIEIIQPTWEDLKRAVMKHGMRNSLVGAQMPTASTSKVLRNSESCEPHIGNIYGINVLAGNFPILNRFLYYDLSDLNLWNQHTRTYLIGNDGKLTGFINYVTNNKHLFPDSTIDLSRLQHIEEKYKTGFEISQKVHLIRAAKRGLYIDQGQSTSTFMEHPTEDKLIALGSLCDYLGLKTFQYYLREAKSAAKVKFTINNNIEKQIKKALSTPPSLDHPHYMITSNSGIPPEVCIPNEEGVCLSCS
jgi:ribonucleoside-diphosphate reductase alpha chain